jgi:hypothetical protein
MKTFNITIKITDKEWKALENMAIADLSWKVNNKPELMKSDQDYLLSLWRKINKEVYKTEEYKKVIQ